MQIPQRARERGLVRSERKDGSRRFVVACERNLVVRAKPVEQCIRRCQVLRVNQIHCGTRLHQHEHLRGRFDGCEISDRLRDAVVQNAEVRLQQPADGIPARIADADSHVD